jgi:hypothetical protein
LLDALGLARRLALGSEITGLVYQWAVETEATRLGASYLLDIPGDEMRRSFARRLNALPSPTSLASAIRTERDILVAHVRGCGLKALAADGIDVPDEEIKRMAKENGSRADAESKSVSRLCAALRECFDKYAEIAALPIEQGRESAEALDEALDAPRESSKGAWIHALRVRPMLIPPVSKLRVSDAKIQATRALFRAALEIAINGSKQASSSKDPFGAGPFRYERLEDGFRLESALKDHEGRPIGLTIRRHRGG